MAILNPYISFRDNAREAMEFYQSVLGGELTVSTFGDFPGMGIDPSENDLVMHSQLTVGDGFILMASDTPSTMPYSAPDGFSISLSGDEGDLLTGYFTGLAEGGTVTLPLDPAPWGGKFGQLTDKFGVGWMVSING